MTNNSEPKLAPEKKPSSIKKREQNQVKKIRPTVIKKPVKEQIINDSGETKVVKIEVAKQKEKKSVPVLVKKEIKAEYLENAKKSLFKATVSKARLDTSKPIMVTEIGIKWSEAIDLDLYCQKANMPEIYFQSFRQDYGKLLHDYTNSSNKTFETIQFYQPIPVDEITAYVNFFSGKVRGNQVKGKYRYRLNTNEVYEDDFIIQSSSGNSGSGKRNSKYWKKLSFKVRKRKRLWVRLWLRFWGVLKAS